MDSDEESDYLPSWRGIPGTIVLINAFENSKYNNFEIAHVATCRLIRQHLRSTSSHYIGVFIFGTEEASSSTFDTKPVTEIIPLSIPSLDDYDKLKKTNTKYFNEAKELKLSDVLWYCSKMFANCKKQLTSRTVILLTRLDTPPITIDQKPTLNRAIDLVDANIDIKLINLSKQTYEIDEYYETLLKISNRGMDFIMPEPIWDPVQIENLMHQESHRNLAVAKLTFEIGDDFKIGVGVYALLKKPGQNYIKTVNLDRDTNTPLVSMTKTIKVSTNVNDEDDEENMAKQVPVLKSELLFYKEFGGKRIEFTDNEMKLMKNPFGPPMMKLLGFKPAEVICKEKWYLKMSYFLFPNESIIEGSTVAFRALHKACTDMNVVAICILCTRVNSKPAIVALSPCAKSVDLDVDVGFDVIIIPFVESFRELNIKDENDDDTAPVEKVHKELMLDIINKITVDFKRDMFENPKIQSEYRALETIALEDDDIEPLIDTTKQSPDKFEHIEDDLFEELFGPFSSLNLKRKTTNPSKRGGKKTKN